MPLRVLHVTSSFPRHAGDAVAPFLLDLVRAQAEAGVEVAVVAPHDAGLASRERVDGITVTRARYGPDHFETLAYRGGLLAAAGGWTARARVPMLLGGLALTVWREARAFRPDVIHAHWWLPSGLAARPAARATHTPLVVTLHGSDVGVASRPGFRAVARSVARHSGYMAAVSAPLLAEAAGVMALDASRSGVLRMPLPPVATAPLLAPGPPWRVIAVGRLSPEKGVDVLIAALAIARRTGLDVRAEIIGTGPELDRLRRARAAAGLDEVVEFVPPVPRAELIRRLGTAHAVVVPSRREGLGLVAVDALALGRPVIASRVGGLVEVVGPGDGLLVTAGDPAALAEALTKLRSLPPPADPQAVRRHAPATVVAEHLAVYERLRSQP